MANENSKSIGRIQSLNTQLNQLLGSESKVLNGESRSAQIISVHNKYHNIVQNDIQAVFNTKSGNQSTYAYLANSIVGSTYGTINRSGNNTLANKSLTGDPKRDQWINRAKLEQLFGSGDTQMTSYFLSTNSDIVHIYDEIDSICAYLYQLEEAVDVIRDNVLSSEEVNEDISMDITFSGTSENTPDYIELVKQAFKYQDLTKKIRSLIVPKAIKYGTYYVMVIPYAEIGVKMMQNDFVNSHRLFESTEVDENGIETTTLDVDGIMENVSVLLESFDEDGQKNPVTESKEQIIRSNLEELYVNENSSPPNITGISSMKFGKMSKDMQDLVDKAIKSKYKKSKNPLKQPNASDGVVDPDRFEDIQGCHIKLVDPRQLVPIKIFDYIIGYYYFENYDYARMGTSLTDIMSNQMNYNDRTMVIDNIVNSVLKNLKYKDVLAGDQSFKTLVLNSILYAERRDNPIRIKFMPPEYVIPFVTNQDEYGNGQPVLLRSLFYGRLYASLLLFNMTAIITKSTDSEFYWLRDSQLDQQYSNQVSDLIDQFNDSNIDPLQIANGNILHGNRAINKRYYGSLGTADTRPFDMEVVSGQQIDIHNDFMTELKKMAISSTGVPSVMLDFIDELEYATMLDMANIKNLKRSNSIQVDFNPSLTQLAKTILKYCNPDAIPEAVLDSLEVKLRSSKTINNNITNQQLSDVSQVAQNMVQLWMKGADTNPPDTQKFIEEEMIKSLTMMLTSAAPWEYLTDIYDRALIKAKEQSLLNKIASQQSEDSE